jgi:hypothetical protein
MALKETVSEREEWIQCKSKVRSRWLTPVHMIMNLRLPMKYGEFLTCSGTIYRLLKKDSAYWSQDCSSSKLLTQTLGLFEVTKCTKAAEVETL